MLNRYNTKAARLKARLEDVNNASLSESQKQQLTRRIEYFDRQIQEKNVTIAQLNEQAEKIKAKLKDWREGYGSQTTGIKRLIMDAEGNGIDVSDWHGRLEKFKERYSGHTPREYAKIKKKNK